MLGPCVVCGAQSENRAHVRDESDCKANGIPDKKNNIIELCRYCHYEIFDKGLMVIRYDEGGLHEFIYFDPILEEIHYKVAPYAISLDSSHVDWKNLNSSSNLQLLL